jgi:transposase-like protein
MSAPPRTYDPAIHPLLVRWTARPGLSDRAIARRIGIGRAQFSRWIAEHPEFAAALEEGRHLADARVVQSIYQRAVGGAMEISEISVDGDKRRVKKTQRQVLPDVAAGMFWLKNRRPSHWRAKPPAPPHEEIIAQMRPIPNAQAEAAD